MLTDQQHDSIELPAPRSYSHPSGVCAFLSRSGDPAVSVTMVTTKGVALTIRGKWWQAKTECHTHTRWSKQRKSYTIGIYLVSAGFFCYFALLLWKETAEFCCWQKSNSTRVTHIQCVVVKETWPVYSMLTYFSLPDFLCLPFSNQSQSQNLLVYKFIASAPATNNKTSLQELNGHKNKKKNTEVFFVNYQSWHVCCIGLRLQPL